jgi:hypothetical protein
LSGSNVREQKQAQRQQAHHSHHPLHFKFFISAPAKPNRFRQALQTPFDRHRRPFHLLADKISHSANEFITPL